MTDFSLLKTLNNEPRLTKVEPKIEYAVYTITTEADIVRQIGVPLHNVEKFDNFIKNNSIELIEQHLSDFDAIDITE